MSVITLSVITLSFVTAFSTLWQTPRLVIRIKIDEVSGH